MRATLTVEELLARAAERDENAFRELHRRLAPRSLRLAREIVSNSKIAHQILDDVFARLKHEVKPLTRARRSPEVWLALETRARAVDWIRARNGSPRWARARLESLPADYSWLPATEEVALLDQRRRLLSKVFGQLPLSQARLVELAVREGLSEQEIAQKLGEPAGKIKSDLRAAIRFLRHRLRAVMGAWTTGI
jgi:RNA polymerase sigma-70 factor (ECF subfamily)